MLVPVPGPGRARLRPLFDGFPGLHGCIDSVLEGVLGEAWADDPMQPRVCLLQLDFNMLAGDPQAPAAAEAIRSIPRGQHLAVPESLEDLLLDVRKSIQPYERFD